MHDVLHPVMHVAMHLVMHGDVPPAILLPVLHPVMNDVMHVVMHRAQHTCMLVQVPHYLCLVEWHNTYRTLKKAGRGSPYASSPVGVCELCLS